MASAYSLQWDGLRVFMACARRGNFTRAAEDLGMSISAVSYQIAGLERSLGVRLFVRTPRGVSLTTDGERLAPAAHAMADALAEGLRVMSAPLTTLRVTAIGDVGVYWLLPRLGQFSQRHPRIRVSLETSSDLSRLSLDGFDVALRHGGGRWPGLVADRLQTWRLQPMATPKVAEGLIGADWLPKTKLHSIDRKWWRLWAECAAVDWPVRAEVCEWDTQLLAAQATLAGLGVGLLSPFAMQDALAKGELVPISPAVLEHDSAHWLAAPRGRRADPAVSAFIAFCLEVAGDPQAAAELHD